ncbi:AAA family ATPase [Oscillochloris sp. ZM17-4]|uniref:AAA family ATPase n=1 Tax=Oscillochloris sp. ZM17-4 TaxID=2866714 RepID=UPI001C73909A|nr:AAA family ATPase [Oscillochloris sp. ZM17-4]MBX0330194.1 AAA family ATPase [Oscillochloris sp. ZM17-4]
MTHEERAHIERLLSIHRASLRELEAQAATFGDLHVPVHVKHQIAEHQGKITELEARMAELLPLHNLPPRDYERFVGRQRELAELRRLLSPRSRAFVITIDGIGGIGKSALALEAAYSYCDGYVALPEAERFDAIVWVSAKRSYLTADGILERRQAFRTLDDLYAAIAQVLDYPAITRARAEEQRAIVEQVLGEQRTLLILDNLETVDDEDLLVFLRELPDPTKAVVTTRHRIDVAHPIRLTGMPHEDALNLIDQEAARKVVTLTEDEREGLWQRTGGVPLAVVWSIGLMGLGGSAESVLRRLGSGQSDIARFCFAESVAHIKGRDTYWLLLALTFFATDASREALGVVAGLGEDTFGRDVGLEELLRLSLVNKDGDRFSLLPLTRSFVQSEAIAASEWIDGAQARLQAYFFAFADTYGGWTLDWQGHDRIERDLPNMLAVIDVLIGKFHLNEAPRETQPLTAEVEQLTRQISSFIPKVSRVCRLRGYWSESDRLSYLGVQVCRLLGDLDELGWRYYYLCWISYTRGELIQAQHWATDARTAWEQCQSDTMCYADRILGLTSLTEGKLDQAEQLLTAAFEGYGAERVGYASADFISAIGQLYAAKGDPAVALDWFRQAVDHARKADNIPSLTSHLLSLGMAQLQCGEIVDAKQYLKESLALAHQCSRTDAIAQTFYGLALLDNHEGQYQSAISNARQALDLFRRLGMRREQAEAEDLLRQLGESA